MQKKINRKTGNDFFMIISVCNVRMKIIQMILLKHDIIH